MRTLQEDRSISVDHVNQQKQKIEHNNGHSSSFDKILNEENYENWSNSDVLLWIKSLEHGLFYKTYPQITQNLKELNITGLQLKGLNEINIQQLGVKHPLHRALILEALNNL